MRLPFAVPLTLIGFGLFLAGCSDQGAASQAADALALARRHSGPDPAFRWAESAALILSGDAAGAVRLLEPLVSGRASRNPADPGLLRA